MCFEIIMMTMMMVTMMIALMIMIREMICVGKNFNEIDISTNYFTLQTYIHTGVLKSYWPDQLLKIRQNIRILLEEGLVGQAKKFSSFLCRCILFLTISTLLIIHSAIFL